MTAASAMTGRDARVLVIGVGNPERGDDGIGPLVVRRLRGQVADDVTLIEQTGDALGLIDAWSGCAAVILVDAAAPTGSPGRVHRVDLRDEVLPAEPARSSTHAFGVAEAVALARALDQLPPSLIAYAIEGDDFGLGAAVSATVDATIGPVATRVMAELRNLTPRNDRPEAATAGRHVFASVDATDGARPPPAAPPRGASRHA